MSILISSGKVLDSLYKNQSGSGSFYTGIYSKKYNVENTAVTDFLSTNQDFRKAVKRLKNNDYSTGLRADVKKSVKQIVKKYNEFVESKGNNSRQYNKAVSDLKKLFEDYGDDLSKIGVEKEGSKLKFNEEKFDESKDSDFEALFSSDGKFINETDRILKNAYRTIKNDQFSTVKEDKYVSNKVSSNNIVYANHANKLAVAAQRLNETELTEDNMDAVVSMINDYTKSIASFYKELTEGIDWSQLETSDKAAEDVNEIIRLNQDYIEAIQKSSEGEPFEYEEWFSADEDSYGSKVTSAYKDLFSELVNAEKKGFEISSFVDYTV